MYNNDCEQENIDNFCKFIKDNIKHATNAEKKFFNTDNKNKQNYNQSINIINLTDALTRFINGDLNAAITINIYWDQVKLIAADSEEHPLTFDKIRTHLVALFNSALDNVAFDNNKYYSYIAAVRAAIQQYRTLEDIDLNLQISNTSAEQTAIKKCLIQINENTQNIKCIKFDDTIYDAEENMPEILKAIGDSGYIELPEKLYWHFVLLDVLKEKHFKYQNQSQVDLTDIEELNRYLTARDNLQKMLDLKINDNKEYKINSELRILGGNLLAEIRYLENKCSYYKLTNVLKVAYKVITEPNDNNAAACLRQAQNFKKNALWKRTTGALLMIASLVIIGMSIGILIATCGFSVPLIIPILHATFSVVTASFAALGFGACGAVAAYAGNHMYHKEIGNILQEIEGNSLKRTI